MKSGRSEWGGDGYLFGFNMCMVSPNPFLFNKSCALKGVNLAKFMDDRLAFVFAFAFMAIL